MFEKKISKKHLITVIKYALGGGLLAWILITTDIDQSREVLTRLSGVTIGAVIAVSITNMLARTVTWYPLVGYFTPTKLGQLLPPDLIIKFVNSIFPSRLSGRLIAPLALRHFINLSWNEATAVTIAHTGLYALLYGSFTLIGLILTSGTYGPGLTLVILLSLGLYLTVGGVVILAGWRLELFDRLIVRISSLVSRLPKGRLLSTSLDGFRDTLLEGSQIEFQKLIRDKKSLGLFMIAWMIAILIIPAARMWILISATNITGVNPLLLPLYIIIAYSVTILPLTPGGIGVAEATAVAVFVALGVPEEGIITIVFVDRLFGVYLPALIGWIPLVRAKFRTAV